MRFVRAWPVPERTDELGGAERDQGAEAGGGAVAAVARAPLAAGEEQRREQRQKQELAVLGEEAKDLFEGVVAVGEAVEPALDVEVQEAQSRERFYTLQRTLQCQ